MAGSDASCSPRACARFEASAYNFSPAAFSSVSKPPDDFFTKLRRFTPSENLALAEAMVLIVVAALPTGANAFLLAQRYHVGAEASGAAGS